MLPGMADTERVPPALRWAGRLLPIAGVLYGMYPDSTCGSAFFPDESLDSWVKVACTDSLADRRGMAILMLFVGFILLGITQVLDWRKPKDKP